MRYSKSKIKINKETGNRYTETITYPTIPITLGDLYIQANEGLRLDLISQQYYNTPKYWWVIALANNMGKGTLYVTASSQLRIPANPQSYENKIRGFFIPFAS